jgi:protein disulfide-isomerase-like protein
MRPDVLTSSNVEAFIKNNDKVLVDFFDPSDPRWREGKADLDNAIRNVRNVGSKVPFATVDVSKEKALAEKYVPDGKYPQLMWFLHGEATQYHRTLRTAKAIGDFVMALDRDPMVAIKTEAEARDFSPAILARVSKNSPAYKSLAIVASKHMDTVAFTYLEGSSNEVSWLPADASPTKFTGDLTVEAIEKWVKMLLLKSEPIPEDPSLLEDEGSKVVVGRNFEDIVLQKDKDVMLLVYAPWCGFCKKFSPIWNSFAQMVSGASDLVIAKMDGSRNGTPLPEDFAWDAYPKIFFVRAGEKKPIHFEGERSVEKLLEFVEKNGSKPLKIDKADKRDASVESVTDL